MNSNFAISLFLLAAIACLSQGCCPERFMQVGNRCYYYNSNEVDWHDARHACNRLGAHLVSIHNYEDSREVYVLWKSLVNDNYLNTWHRVNSRRVYLFFVAVWERDYVIGNFYFFKGYWVENMYSSEEMKEVYMTVRFKRNKGGGGGRYIRCILAALNFFFLSVHNIV